MALVWLFRFWLATFAKRKPGLRIVANAFSLESYNIIALFLLDFVGLQLRRTCLTDKRFHQMPKKSLNFSPLFRRL
jgi:hypothetical protein